MTVIFTFSTSKRISKLSSKLQIPIFVSLTLIRESWKQIQNAGPSPSVFCGKKIQSAALNQFVYVPVLWNFFPESALGDGLKNSQIRLIKMIFFCHHQNFTQCKNEWWSISKASLAGKPKKLNTHCWLQVHLVKASGVAVLLSTKLQKYNFGKQFMPRSYRNKTDFGQWKFGKLEKLVANDCYVRSNKIQCWF